MGGSRSGLLKQHRLQLPPPQSAAPSSSSSSFFLSSFSRFSLLAASKLASIQSILCAPVPPKEQEESEAASPHASTSPTLKRPLPTRAASSPAKKQSKWTPEEDALLIELRGQGMKWDDIALRLPGRSALSCRLHYQNYLERRPEWDEDKKDKLAMLYERLRADMWHRIACEMEIPWRAVEAMHWQMGEKEMAKRAGVVPFSQSSVALDAPKKRGPAAAYGAGSSKSTSPTSSSAATPRGPAPEAE